MLIEPVTTAGRHQGGSRQIISLTAMGLRTMEGSRCFAGHGHCCRSECRPLVSQSCTQWEPRRRSKIVQAVRLHTLIWHVWLSGWSCKWQLQPRKKAERPARSTPVFMQALRNCPKTCSTPWHLALSAAAVSPQIAQTLSSRSPLPGPGLD